MPKTNKEEKVAPKSAAKAPTTAPVKSAPVQSPEKDKFSKLDFEVPDVKELLKAGVQFGHQISRWNPKMQKHIYTKRGNIHIINIADTHDNLEKALLFLANAASRGEVLFVGTKRQAREIIKETAIDAGAYYITHRWVGGLLTNYNFTDRSLKKLNKLEQAFETGVQGRTKFEVSLMKKEWERLNRLYEGVKALNRKPTAVVILDSKYERNVVREARILNIPIVAIVDTNADPEQVNYPIPGNDDALSAIKLYFDLFAKAVKQGNGGHGIKHTFKDYTKYEVAIKKVAVTAEEDAKEIGQAKTIVEKEQPAKVVVKRQLGEGILEGVQKAKETAQSNVVEEPVVVKAVEKKAVKVEKKAAVKETAAKKTVKVAKNAEKKPAKKVVKKPAKKAAKKAKK